MNPSLILAKLGPKSLTPDWKGSILDVFGQRTCLSHSIFPSIFGPQNCEFYCKYLYSSQDLQPPRKKKKTGNGIYLESGGTSFLLCSVVPYKLIPAKKARLPLTPCLDICGWALEWNGQQWVALVPVCYTTGACSRCEGQGDMVGVIWPSLVWVGPLTVVLF